MKKDKWIEVYEDGGEVHGTETIKQFNSDEYNLAYEFAKDNNYDIDFVSSIGTYGQHEFTKNPYIIGMASINYYLIYGCKATNQMIEAIMDYLSSVSTHLDNPLLILENYRNNGVKITVKAKNQSNQISTWLFNGFPN